MEKEAQAIKIDEMISQSSQVSSNFRSLTSPLQVAAANNTSRMNQLPLQDSCQPIVSQSSSLSDPTLQTSTQSSSLTTQAGSSQQNQQNSQLLQSLLENSQLLRVSSLANQLCPLGPKDRCTPSQAQAMGQQILALMVTYESNDVPMPYELQNTFDIFHRCLAVAYGTFFLNLYTKANAPCLLCHGCKSLYPPGQYIHHACPALPPNIVPCRSRMWRRCLVPLVSQGIDKMQQKERWRYVLEKFSHSSMGVVRRSRLPLDTETHLLDMPECKRGRFIKSPSETPPENSTQTQESSLDQTSSSMDEASISDLMKYNEKSSPLYVSSDDTLLLEETDTQDEDLEASHDIEEHVQQQEGTAIQSSCEPAQKARELVEELLKEIRRLEKELQTTQNALQSTNKQLTAIIKSNSLSEQLAQSVIAQDKLTIERDRALQRAKVAEDRVELLEKHVNQIQKLQNEVL